MRILIYFIIVTQVCLGQNISKSGIIDNSIVGHWEIDYKNLRDCEEGKIIKHVKGKESSLDFYSNGHYRRLTWGFESGGIYTLNKNDLLLDEKYQLEDENSTEQKHKLGIEELVQDTLIISFIECDTKIEQTYLRKKSTQNDLGMGVVLVSFGSNDIYGRNVSFYEDYNSTKLIFQITKGYENLDSLKIFPLEIIYPVSTLCFRCVADSGNMYKVVVNNISGKTAWLKKDKYNEFKNWLSYLQDASYINTKNPLRINPDDKSQMISNKDSCWSYNILTMKNDWIEVQTSIYCDLYGEKLSTQKIKGWTKWREGDKIIVMKMYTE